MMLARRLRTFVLVGLAGMAALLSTGLMACDTTVEPFVRPEQPFSIIGVLEAGRDTQFVRISVVGDSTAFGAPPEPLDAVVTTEHLATGRLTTWEDSLFRFRQVREVGVEEIRWAHTAWTTANFQPGATYRFTVTGPAGQSSSATVTLPDTSFDVNTIPPQMSPYWRIRVQDVEWIADVVVVLEERFASGQTRTSNFSVVGDTIPQGLDGYGVRVRAAEIRRRLHDGVAAASVRVSKAGPDWPRVVGIDPDSLIVPGAISNVENGYGYLGGVATKSARLCGPRAERGC